jgi:hypothetical protein
MTDLSNLRDKLFQLRHQALTKLADLSDEKVGDAGLLALLANVQCALTAIADEEDQAPWEP